MATIREYQRVQGSTLVKVRILTDLTGGYVLLVTSRVPNPEYQSLGWQDRRDVPSHLHTAHTLQCNDEQSALTAYHIAVTLDRTQRAIDRNHSELTAR